MTSSTMYLYYDLNRQNEIIRPDDEYSNNSHSFLLIKQLLVHLWNAAVVNFHQNKDITYIICIEIQIDSPFNITPKLIIRF